MSTVVSSRPRALALAVAVLAMSHAASSAADPDPVTPAIAGVVAGGIKIRLIKDGLNGSEGPIAQPDGSLLFTETRANRIVHVGLDDKISSFLENSNGSNGLAYTSNGELVSVQTAKASVGVVAPKDKAKVWVDGFESTPLRRPNDLVIDRKGGVYFTDPGPFRKADEPASPTAVYYRTPAGELRRIATDITWPNGIQLSPEERVLYVADTHGEFVIAYDVADDGSVSNRRNFARLQGWNKSESGNGSSGADGLAVDSLGRLYVASSAGIEVFDAAGKALGVIPIPGQTQNLAFAGPDKKTLYVVGGGKLYRFAVLTPGLSTRAK